MSLTQTRSRRPAHPPVTSSLPDPHVCLAIMRAFNSHLDSPSHGGPGPTGNGEWRGSNQCSQSQRGGNTPAAEPRAASGPCQQTANDSTEDKRHPGLTPVTARTGWERRLAYHTSTHTSTDGPTTVQVASHTAVPFLHRRAPAQYKRFWRASGATFPHPEAARVGRFLSPWRS